MPSHLRKTQPADKHTKTLSAHPTKQEKPDLRCRYRTIRDLNPILPQPSILSHILRQTDNSQVIKIETKFIRAKLDYEEKGKQWQRNINNIEFCNMGYLESYMLTLVNIITKLGIVKPILVCFTINYLI